MVGCWSCWLWNNHSEHRFNLVYYGTYFDEFNALFDEAIHIADSAVQQKRLELLSASMIYNGCYAGVYLAYQNNDRDRISNLCDKYQLMLERLHKNGFSKKSITTVDGAKVSYESDLLTEATLWWCNGGEAERSPFYIQMQGVDLISLFKD